MRSFLFIFIVFIVTEYSFAENSTCNQSKQAIGLACLHCTSPEAKEQSIQIAEILRDSCRKNIAISVLMDNSFGTDYKNIENIIKVSTSKGAKLKLYLYYGNGPWQRKANPPSTLGFGTNIKPKQFRTEILSNSILQNEFKNNLLASKDLLILNTNAGGSNFIIPMLEDNLDKESASYLEKLVKDILVISDNLNYSIGRNPCPACYPGNDDSVNSGTFLDQHINSATNIILTKDGLVTNDGLDFYFPWEKPENRLSLKNIKKLITNSHRRNNTFILWRATSQGITNTKKMLSPENREYPIFNNAEVSELKEILSEN